MQVQAENGNFNCDFKFLDAKVTDTKPELAGLPSSYGASQTLTVIMEDKALCAQLHLFYTVFENCNVITRSARLINNGEKTIKIHSLMSMQIDLPAGDYTMLSFDGAWIRERYQHERKLTAGECSIGSICGTSSNRHNPFFAIRKGDCNEQAGECWGINLVYSGNHIGRVEVAPHGMVRVQNGINPFEFEWALAPGQSFDAPESVLTYSHEGLNGMSRNMHAFVRSISCAANGSTRSARSLLTIGRRPISSLQRRKSSPLQGGRSSGRGALRFGRRLVRQAQQRPILPW